jgi:hypothetical protein
MVDNMQTQLNNIDRRFDRHIETSDERHREVVSYIETVDGKLMRLEMFDHKEEPWDGVDRRKSQRPYGNQDRRQR